MNETPTFDEGLCGRIDARLHALRLPGAAACFRSQARETGADEATLRFLDAVLGAELESRELRRYQRNLRAARFPVVKELAAFDFGGIPSLSKERVDELATGRFVAAHECLILVGNPGTGKTHLLLALGLEAIQSGYRVRFVTAAALVNEFLLPRQELRVPKLLRFYGRFDLVLVDELGYVPFSRDAWPAPLRVLLRPLRDPGHRPDHEPALRPMAAGLRRRDHERRPLGPADPPEPRPTGSVVGRLSRDSWRRKPPKEWGARYELREEGLGVTASLRRASDRRPRIRISEHERGPIGRYRQERQVRNTQHEETKATSPRSRLRLRGPVAL